MMRKPNESPRSGWTYGEEGHPNLPRNEMPSEIFHRIEIPAAPSAPAWNEPGYLDPDAPHEHLPEGARYWQGMVKPARAESPEEERPLSPGLVERITRKYWKGTPPSAPSEDSGWERHNQNQGRNQGRDHERDRISRDHSLIWPG